MTVKAVTVFITDLPGQGRVYHSTKEKAIEAHYLRVDTLLSSRLMAKGFTRSDVIKIVGELVEDPELRHQLTKAFNCGDCPDG